MSRIRKAYQARFRALLLRLRARRPEAGVRALTARSRQRSVSENVPEALACSDAYERLRSQVSNWEKRSGTVPPRSPAPPDRFLCDAGLGGLARWLRAAGYEALWFPDIDDADLLRRAQRFNATVLTTDSLMMERGVLRDGIIRALWLPPTLKKREQLAVVLREFSLEVREPRCMSCGGELRPTDKESLRERIPPKTWRWRDDYFVCANCGRLFWRGTHWQRIEEALKVHRVERM